MLGLSKQAVGSKRVPCQEPGSPERERERSVENSIEFAAFLLEIFKIF